MVVGFLLLREKNEEKSSRGSGRVTRLTTLPLPLPLLLLLLLAVLGTDCSRLVASVTDKVRVRESDSSID